MTSERPSSQSVWELVKALVQEIKEGQLALPVLPRLVEDLQATLDDPNRSLDKIARVVEKDVALAGRLIAVANSPYYCRQKKSQTVKEAILRLGETETDHIVIAVANRSLFKTQHQQFKKLMESLWRHSLATAHAARLIAEHLNLSQEENYFFMGLLHDVGKTIILQKLSEMPAFSDSGALSSQEIVRSMAEAHLSIGGVILRKWRFEKNFVRVATLHEGPKFYPPVARAVLIVHLANALTRNIGYTLIPESPLDLADLDSARRLKLSAEVLSAICEKTRTVMAAVEIS